MLTYTPRITSNNFHQSLRAVCVILVLLTTSILISGQVAAEPRTTPPIQTHCFKVVPDKIQSGVCTGSKVPNGNDLLDKVMMTASWHCQKVDAANGDKATCILKKGQDFLTTTAQKKPTATTAKIFKDRLLALLQRDAEANDGSTSYYSPDSEQSISDEVCESGSTNCTIVDTPDPAACAASPSLAGCNTNANAHCTTKDCDLVKKYINPGIQLLTIVFGLIAAISIILGGLQYSASTGDPQKVQAAKTRLKMTLVAIVAYAFLYSFIEFLVPGGIFK